MAMEFKPIASGGGGDTETLLRNDLPELSLEVQEYNVVEERQAMTQQLQNSKEIDSIVSQINAYEVNTVVTFGNETAGEIARVSDQVLKSVNMEQINESGKLLETLGRIMDRFDLQEIAKPEPKGLLGKLKGSLQKQLDKLLAKYQTMGDDVDKVYVELKAYEAEIQRSNKSLDALFEANVGYYKNLVKYILAGEQAAQELKEHIEKMRAEYDRTQDNILGMDINSMEQVLITLEQRVMDLKMAEHVAMQSIPMIKSMQFSNLNLIRKINSAFIVTLPVFKQALTQAVLLKRQRIQSDAMKALDERTNEMLLKNAKNTAEQTKLTAQLAGSSSIKIETLEKTWHTIVRGLEETQAIQQSARQKREDDAKRLSELKANYERHTTASA